MKKFTESEVQRFRNLRVVMPTVQYKEMISDYLYFRNKNEMPKEPSIRELKRRQRLDIEALDE